MIPLYKTDVFNNILVAAHRGDQSNAIENSIEAFEDAIKCGVDMIEADIHITKDKRFVIYHNSEIRISNVKKPISEFTLSEIKTHIIEDDVINKKANIPELSELLTIAKNKCYLNLEVKKNTNYSSKEYFDLLINDISIHGDINQVLFASFYYDLLSDCKTIAPNIPIAAIRIPSNPLLPEDILKFLEIDAYITSQSSLNKKISESASKNNVILASYSIDTKAHFDRAMSYNVKALGTNRAKDLVKIVKKYRNS